MLKKVILLSILSLFILTVFVLAEEKAAPVSSMKSDLIVDQLYVKILDKIPKEGIKVRVVFTVKNVSSYSTNSALTSEGKKNCSEGCFIVRLNVLRNYPYGRYAMLCEKKCRPLRSGESETFYCDDFVKVGTESKYQSLADYFNWIDESNEANNEKTTSIR